MWRLQLTQAQHCIAFTQVQPWLVAQCVDQWYKCAGADAFEANSAPSVDSQYLMRQISHLSSETPIKSCTTKLHPQWPHPFHSWMFRGSLICKTLLHSAKQNVSGIMFHVTFVLDSRSKKDNPPTWKPKMEKSVNRLLVARAGLQEGCLATWDVEEGLPMLHSLLASWQQSMLSSVPALMVVAKLVTFRRLVIPLPQFHPCRSKFV